MNILKPFMALCLMQALPCTVRAAQPDSVYVFPYPTTNDHGRRGMQFVWSADGKHWQDVAEGMVFMEIHVQAASDTRPAGRKVALFLGLGPGRQRDRLCFIR